MSTTVSGYNRNASTGVTTQVLGIGTNLVDKDGKNVTLPTGYVVVSVRLQHLSNTTAPADGPGGNVADTVEVRCDTNVLISSSFASLTSDNHTAVVGSGTAAAPTVAKTAVNTLKLHGLDNGTGDADLADNGAVFCVVVKMKPMPTL